MKPREFLDLADELVVGMSEGAWRSAVSRADYAAFHTARHFLIGLGFKVPEAESAHHCVYVRLNNAGNAHLSYTASLLYKLRRERNTADYDLAGFYPGTTAGRQVRDATDIVLVLEEYAADPARFPALTAAIAAYERDALREVTHRPPGAPAPRRPSVDFRLPGPPDWFTITCAWISTG